MSETAPIKNIEQASSITLRSIAVLCDTILAKPNLEQDADKNYVVDWSVDGDVETTTLLRKETDPKSTYNDYAIIHVETEDTPFASPEEEEDTVTSARRTHRQMNGSDFVEYEGVAYDDIPQLMNLRPDLKRSLVVEIRRLYGIWTTEHDEGAQAGQEVVGAVYLRVGETDFIIGSYAYNGFEMNQESLDNMNEQTAHEYEMGGQTVTRDDMSHLARSYVGVSEAEASALTDELSRIASTEGDNDKPE